LGGSLITITKNPRVGEILINLGLVSFNNRLCLVPYGTEAERKAVVRAVLRIAQVKKAYVTDEGRLVVTFTTNNYKLPREDFMSALVGADVEVRRVLAGIGASVEKRVKEQRRLREAAAQREFDEAVAKAQAKATISVNS